MDDDIFPSAWQIPTDYKIKTAAHLGLLPGSDLAVYDARGVLAFSVRRAGSSHPRGARILSDAAGAPLIVVVHHEAGWQGFRANSLEAKDLIFSVQKILCSAFKTELEGTLSGRNMGDLSSSLRLKGSPFQRSCTIYRGESVVAQTNLLYKLNTVIYSRRKFRLTIFPGNDHALIIAMLAVFLGGSRLFDGND